MADVKVAIMMGSKSDLEVMKAAAAILEEFQVSYDIRVLSAHRTPKECAQYAEEFRSKGGEVFICGAGMSAALSGTVAAHTTLPVIGVPLDASSLNGMDALLATTQMPPGVPVGSVAIGKAGAKNAAYLAIRIMSLIDKTLEDKLNNFREEQRKNILNTELN
jgi:phosphoribosylaminoimidazole carboxylase PurE protein